MKIELTKPIELKHIDSLEHTVFTQAEVIVPLDVAVTVISEYKQQLEELTIVRNFSKNNLIEEEIEHRLEFNENGKPEDKIIKEVINDTRKDLVRLNNAILNNEDIYLILSSLSNVTVMALDVYSMFEPEEIVKKLESDLNEFSVESVNNDTEEKTGLKALFKGV